MKKKILCLLMILILPVCLLFTSCSNIEKDVPKKSMFKVVDEFILGGSNHYVLVNKDTKVMYLVENKGGMTVMLNEDGTPMLWDGEL